MQEKAKPKQKQKREKKQTEKNTEARLVFTLLTYMIKLKLGIDQESNMATGVHNHSTQNIISNKNRKANENQRKNQGIVE